MEMFFKRIAAVAAVLALLVQLTGCKTTEPSLSLEQSSNQVTSSDTLSNVQETDSELLESVPEPTQTDDENGSGQSSVIESSSAGTNSSADKNTLNSDIPQEETVGGDNDNATSTNCTHGTSDPYQNVTRAEFYSNYTTACCNLDAQYRSKHGFLSGSLDVPGQYAVESANRPTLNGKYVRNTSTEYTDNGNTYIVTDANGGEVMRIHKAGGYITLEEVAAYMYAFGGSGQIPANYTTKKKANPGSSIWGEYLRVNHSYFLGDTNKYPYEPELPNISGCGGNLRYYEMDIGTTGTATPGYAAKPYINDSKTKINRGAARLVYARQDLNGNGVYENDEVYVFYTHNHYNDFREYLNYYGGWGEMFGNVTGGGEYSSKTNANPTPYVETEYSEFYKQ